MKVNKSNMEFSQIVLIGEKLKDLSSINNYEYLPLNRGVNAVTNIDISYAIKSIDFSSDEALRYPPILGILSVRKAISDYYFDDIMEATNISITPGGMPSLDLIFQILKGKLYFPRLFWDSYQKIATIRNHEFDFYDTLDGDYFDSNSIIVICDPSNPTGLKLDDNYLLFNISKLAHLGHTIVFDSPYYRLFKNNEIFIKLLELPNVIICESFSKSFGLSGLRIGFIHCKDKEFNNELNTRLLYSFNGVSAISQLIINELIIDDTYNDDSAVSRFKYETISAIKENIKYLKKLKLTENDDTLMGIFCIVNKSEEQLLEKRIGSVGMDKFTNSNKNSWNNYSRICLSVDSTKFKEFFKQFENE